MNKVSCNAVQMEAVATLGSTLGFDVHWRHIAAMEFIVTNRADIGLRLYVSSNGERGASNTIHK